MQKNRVFQARLRYLASVAASLVLLALLVRQSELARLLESASNVSLTLVFASYAVTLIARLLESIALASSLKAQQAPSSLLVALQSAAIANLAGFIVPGDMASGVAKWTYLSHSSRNPAAALRTVVSLRLILLSLATAVSLAASLAFPKAPTSELQAMQIAIILLGSLALWLIWSRSGAALLARGTPIFNKLRILRSVNSQIPAHAREHGASEILKQAVTLTAATFLAAAGLSLALSSTGVTIPFALVLYVYGFLLLARQLPITFAGIGLRELVLIGFLQPFGLPSEQLIVAGLLLLGPQILLALIGLAVIARFPIRQIGIQNA